MFTLLCRHGRLHYIDSSIFFSFLMKINRKTNKNKESSQSTNENLSICISQFLGLSNNKWVFRTPPQMNCKLIYPRVVYWVAQTMESRDICSEFLGKNLWRSSFLINVRDIDVQPQTLYTFFSFTATSTTSKKNCNLNKSCVEI